MAESMEFRLSSRAKELTRGRGAFCGGIPNHPTVADPTQQSPPTALGYYYFVIFTTDKKLSQFKRENCGNNN